MIPSAPARMSDRSHSIAALKIAMPAPGRPSNDWIGLYKVGDPDSANGWWQYTGGATSGSFTLQAPFAAGSYEFRYLIQGSQTDILRSAAVTV